MRKYLSPLGLAVLALAACQSAAVPEDAARKAAAARRARQLFDQPAKAKAGDTIVFGDFMIENNLWNTAGLPAGSYTQEIYYSADASGPLFGWKWSFAKGDVNSYPEIIYGWKPWCRASTTAALPRRIGDIDYLKADYSVDMTFTRRGSWNLAFDNWICSAPGQPTGATTKYELMIWEDKSGLRPFGLYQGTVATTNGAYGLYRGEPTWEPDGFNWTYLAFVRTRGRRAGTVDIDEMLFYLVEKGIVPADYYLASIEFGNEAGNSAAAVVCDRFAVRFDAP